MTQMPNASFYQTLFRAFLFVAVALSLAMAILSPTAKQVHHDEYDHINAARFYTKHWLPPAIGDPRTLDSYSLYGASYLNEWDVVYLFAGKFAAVVNPFLDNLALSLRLFNVSLFLLLACLALLARSLVLCYAVLLTSPQIWYTFGYFNGDSFPLFVSFLIVAIVATPEDTLPQGSRRALGRYLLLGICVGLLVLSKKTFWMFGLFTVCLVAWLEFCRWRREQDRGGFVRNMGVLAVMIVAIAVPRIAYDVYINGTPAQKGAKLVEIGESLAAPIFKPSKSLKSSLKLREKGVGLFDMIDAIPH